MEPEKEDMLPRACITARIATRQQSLDALPEEAVVAQRDTCYVFMQQAKGWEHRF
jgi:hypothetical protein